MLQSVHLINNLKLKRTLLTQVIRSLNENYFIKFQEFNKLETEKQTTLPVFKTALFNGNHNCIKDFFGQYTYSDLFQNSKKLSRQISNICGSGSNSTVAFFSDNSALTVLMLWATWMSGQVVIPLKWNEASLYFNSPFIKANNIQLLLSPEKFEELGRKLAFANNIPLLIIKHKFIKPSDVFDMSVQNKFFDGILLNSFYDTSGAYLFYEFPNQNEFRNCEAKTILQTHKELNDFVKMAIKTWHLSESDRILNITPNQFYNNEFIYNMLYSLTAGSHINIMERIDEKSLWNLILNLNLPFKERYNVLLAEPNVYEALVQEYENIIANNADMVEYIKNYCLNNYRLMIISCGYLNPLVFSAWMKITGHSLLENTFLKIINMNEKNISHLPHEDSAKKIRVVDANHTILLESDERHIKRLPSSEFKVIVGRLMVLRADTKEFKYTGEIVSYFKRVLKVLGQHR